MGAAGVSRGAGLWSIVFPLGMYSVAGSFLGQADRLPIVRGIGDAESRVALAAWPSPRESSPSPP